MIRLGLARSVAKSLQSPNPTLFPRHYAKTTAAAAIGESPPERVASEMIRYALGDAKSKRPPGWREEAMRILEQGATNLQGGGEGSAEAVGMLMLAMSTLLYHSGKRQDAMEKLEAVRQVAPSPAFRVAAWEALMGLRMEAGQDVNSSINPDDSFDIPMGSPENKVSDVEPLKLRVDAVRGLVDLLNGDIESANSFFEGCHNSNVKVGKDHIGNAVLSYGEYLHCTANLSLAREMYEMVLHAMEMKDTPGRYLSAANMVPEEISMGATCSFGQLLSQSGRVNEAEELLTKALTDAEDYFGSNHPKVGVVLTCVARMYKDKAKLEGSSSILVQEGLYRKALDLLKAPALNSEGASTQMDWRDVVTLARGEYAELLLIQSNRKEEGKQMKKWAESEWRNRRLSLDQALEFSDPSKPAVVVDTRLGRVL